MYTISIFSLDFNEEAQILYKSRDGLLSISIIAPGLLLRPAIVPPSGNRQLKVILKQPLNDDE